MDRTIALVGAGHWGKNHLKNLENIGVLHSVFEASGSMVAERKKDFPDVCYVEAETDILNNPGIQGIVIAVPAAMHFEMAKKYLLAGESQVFWAYLGNFIRFLQTSPYYHQHG